MNFRVTQEYCHCESFKSQYFSFVTHMEQYASSVTIHIKTA
jgi:hypothetical protein